MTDTTLEQRMKIRQEANPAISAIIQDVKASRSYERPTKLGHIYKQLVISHHGRQGEGKHRQNIDKLSLDGKLITIHDFANMLVDSGMTNHAKRACKQYVDAYILGQGNDALAAFNQDTLTESFGLSPETKIKAITPLGDALIERNGKTGLIVVKKADFDVKPYYAESRYEFRVFDKEYFTKSYCLPTSPKPL